METKGLQISGAVLVESSYHHAPLIHVHVHKVLDVLGSGFVKFIKKEYKGKNYFEDDAAPINRCHNKNDIGAIVRERMTNSIAKNKNREMFFVYNAGISPFNNEFFFTIKLYTKSYEVESLKDGVLKTYESNSSTDGRFVLGGNATPRNGYYPSEIDNLVNRLTNDISLHVKF